MLAQLLIGLGAYAQGDFADAAPMLRVALELAEELDGDAASEEPIALLFAGRAALYLGDDQAAYRSHREAAARARASGVLSIVTQILPRLAIAELWAGRAFCFPAVPTVEPPTASSLVEAVDSALLDRPRERSSLVTRTATRRLRSWTVPCVRQRPSRRGSAGPRRRGSGSLGKAREH